MRKTFYKRLHLGEWRYCSFLLMVDKCLVTSTFDLPEAGPRFFLHRFILRRSASCRHNVCKDFSSARQPEGDLSAFFITVDVINVSHRLSCDRPHCPGPWPALLAHVPTYLLSQLYNTLTCRPAQTSHYSVQCWDHCMLPGCITQTKDFDSCLGSRSKCNPQKMNISI